LSATKRKDGVHFEDEEGAQNGIHPEFNGHSAIKEKRESHLIGEEER